MKTIAAILLGAAAMVAASASAVSAKHTRVIVVPAPPYEGRSVYVRPSAPADFACTPYTCREGGRRNPAANPEGDVFDTGVP